MDFKGMRTQNLYPRHSRSTMPMMPDIFRICSIIGTDHIIQSKMINKKYQKKTHDFKAETGDAELLRRKLTISPI
jgi:hypothetical protein